MLAPSRVLCQIHYINLDLRRHFIICGYGIFPSLRCTISYPWNMSAYYLWIIYLFPLSLPCGDIFLYHFSFVSTFYPILSHSISTLDSNISSPIFMLESISSWFDLNLTTFQTRSLVEGGPIWRVSTCFHPIITTQNLVDRSPCRTLVNKYVSICSVLQYAMEILLLSILSLAQR